MPQRDYQSYAKSPAGKAARQRAHDRYVAKRREQNAALKNLNPQPLAKALANWSRTCKS